MIDPHIEELITPQEATRLYPRSARGKKVHVSRVYRDMSRGSRGVRLESIRTPRLATSRQAVARFFAGLDATMRQVPHADGSTPRSSAVGPRRRPQAEVAHLLESLGFGAMDLEKLK